MPTIEELDAKIATVKQQIADRNAMIVPQPKTRVGWASYIIDNDRGLLDKYADAERAWYQMKLQQEQQDKLQKEQQKFAKELAREQRNQQDLIQMDENMKARANAAVKYNYALQNLDRANKSGIKADIDKAQLELALSRHELDYYNKRTGYTEPKLETINKEEPNSETREDKASVPVKLEESKSKKSFKTEQDKKDHLANLKSMDPDGQNKEVQAEINRIKGITSTEASNALLAKANEEYAKTGKYDKNIFKVKYSNNKATLVFKAGK